MDLGGFGNLGTTALVGAGFGSLMAMWGQIKGLFVRFWSVFIVSAEFQGQAESAINAYLWKHFKVSRFGDRKFTGFGAFVKPLSRIGMVGFESTGKNLTFWKGWKPVFVSEPKNSDGSSGLLTIHFIRGTFDLDKFLIAAMDELDSLKHGAIGDDNSDYPDDSSNKSRFYVRKVFGRSSDSSNNAGLAQSQPKSPDIAGFNRPDLRPIKWKIEELGQVKTKTPFNALAYSESVRNFEKEIRRWHASENWFKDRGLKWRFGGGLYGPPGTGKTSFARAIAQELDMPIHSYDLTTMSNEELVNFWDESLACAPCVVLLEDIDRIFDKEKNIKQALNKSPLTLDCLLNCINGVATADGILVMVTANDMSKVDPALGIANEKGDSTRPGRLDRTVCFGPLDEAGREFVAKRILAGYEEFIPKLIKEGEGETGAQFESRCSKIALEKYWSTK